MTADGGQEKRRIGLGRGVLIVLVGAVASAVVGGVAILVWALCFDGSVRPPLGLSVFSRGRDAMIGALMAGAAVFVWRRPGAVGGLCSIVFVLAIHLGDFLAAAWTALFYGFRSVVFPDFTADLVVQMVLFSAVVWTLPLLCSVLPWRQGVSLGALILAAYGGYGMWMIWNSMAPEMGDNSQLVWHLGSWFLRTIAPVLIGFVAACLMLPRERSRPVSVTTVPSRL